MFDISELETFIRENAQHSLVIAYSGGIDSACLVELVSKLTQNEHKANIIVAHYNHNWSEQANITAHQCEKYIQSRYINMQYISGKAETQGQTNENLARQMRYAFLEETALKYNAKYILTAHHLQDNIETFFLQLCRGAGFSGLKGIKNIRNSSNDICIFRPLLNANKQELVIYAQENNIKVFEDKSNLDTSIKRNYLRHEILPKLEKLYSQYAKSIARTIQIAREEEVFWRKYIDDIIKTKLPLENQNECAIFSELPVAVQRRYLKAYLDGVKNIGFRTIEKVRLAIIKKINYKENLEKELFFVIKKQRFFLIKIEQNYSKNSPKNCKIK